MKLQTDNPSPGAVAGEISSHKRGELRYTIIGQFRRRNQRFREVIPVPDSLIKYFTLDGEVWAPIKQVKATQKSNIYRFKGILLLWVSALFAMMCINLIYVKIQVSWALNRFCKVRLG